MDAHAVSEGHLFQEGRHSTLGSPFSQSIDAELAAVLGKLVRLYEEGRRTFVIVTHRDPDADAIAGCLGMDRLIRGLLPSDVTIRWMHDGELCSSLRGVVARKTESITGLPGVFEGAPEGSVAVVVVDQPGLHSCAVLPRSMRLDPVLGNREADIIVDHHGDSLLHDGAVCVPESGSTAALVYRLLQLAHNHERYQRASFSDQENARFALLLNVGARTDAGQNVVGPLAKDVSPYVSWVVRETEGNFSTADAKAFDVLAASHGALLETAKREALVFDGVDIDGVLTQLVLAYAGVADSAHCIGACASKLFDHERAKTKGAASHLPLAVVVCGIIRPEDQQGAEVVHAGERVQISIRTDLMVDAEFIAERISAAGGGRAGAAAAQISVPKKYDSLSDSFYVAKLLELLEVKLTWPEQYSWNLDARG